jgi:hypothetical protein
MKWKQLGMTTLGIFLLIIVVLLLFGALPTWPYAHSWGYAPSGILTILLIVVVVLLIAGRL